MTNIALYRRTAQTVAACTISLLLAQVGGCGHGGPPPMPPPSVNIAVVHAVNIAESQLLSGQLEGLESAEIRPRVTGTIERVEYVEGSEVKKGSVLFLIDDREYRASVDAATANLARAQSRLELARHELTRTESLAKSDAASQSELEQRRAEFNQATADRDSSSAQLKSAQLNLEFSHVSAPFDGRAGKAEVRTGNLVNANSTLLTTLVRLDPLYVNFSVDEQTFLKLRRVGTHAKVRVLLDGESDFNHEGSIDFIDNQVDRASGTIRIRAKINNPDHQLIPGLIVNVQVESSEIAPHWLIAEQAILTDQDRQFVYVVGTDNKALRKDVTIGAHINGLVAVQSGLADGDRVVVDGTRKIFASGQPVIPTVVDMTHPEGGVSTVKQ